jgi:IS1 family transposase
MQRIGRIRRQYQVVIKIAGVKHWLWRATDQGGMVLDVLVQSRRDKQAAKRRLQKLLKKPMISRYNGDRRRAALTRTEDDVVRFGHHSVLRGFGSRHGPSLPINSAASSGPQLPLSYV